MTILKRELQLSQDLMSLQSQYNSLQTENNRLASLLKKSMENGRFLGEEVSRLQDNISILKSVSKKTMSATAKKLAAQK